MPDLFVRQPLCDVPFRRGGGWGEESACLGEARFLALHPNLAEELEGHVEAGVRREKPVARHLERRTEGEDSRHGDPG